MSLNVRIDRSDPRLYHPGRDVAWNFKHVALEVDRRLARGQWKELEALLEREDVTDDELAEANTAFVQFIVTCTEHPKETMMDVLTRTGWFKCHPTAQIAYLAYMGTVLAGVYFDGVREVTLGGAGPCSDTGALRASCLRASLILTTPRWRRWLLRVKWRVQEVLRAFRGKTTSTPA